MKLVALLTITDDVSETNDSKKVSLVWQASSNFYQALLWLDDQISSRNIISLF